MKLVKFDRQDTSPIWINPDLVQSVHNRGHHAGHDITEIRMSGSPNTVGIKLDHWYSTDEVVAMLSGSTLRRVKVKK